MPDHVTPSQVCSFSDLWEVSNVSPRPIRGPGLSSVYISQEPLSDSGPISGSEKEGGKWTVVSPVSVQARFSKVYAVYVNLIRHKFILFSMKVCHLGMNQYPNGMKTYHLIVESGGKNVSKKFSEQFYDGMWNNFFKICINSSAIDQKGWKSLFVWYIPVWIYTILVWIQSTLVWFNELYFTFTFVNNKLSELFALCCIITIPIPFYQAWVLSPSPNPTELIV